MAHQQVDDSHMALLRRPMQGCHLQLKSQRRPVLLHTHHFLASSSTLPELVTPLKAHCSITHSEYCCPASSSTLPELVTSLTGCCSVHIPSIAVQHLAPLLPISHMRPLFVSASCTCIARCLKGFEGGAGVQLLQLHILSAFHHTQ